MRQQADAEGLTRIAMPRIGVGYGGLSWKKVRAIVEAVFGDWEGTLVVYEELCLEVPILPDFVFAVCYVTAHLALDLMDEKKAEAILNYCEEHLEE